MGFPWVKPLSDSRVIHCKLLARKPKLSPVSAQPKVNILLTEKNDTMFYIFYRNANDTLCLYRADNMLIICVWMISITFKYVEI
jgi:hypothetical protein